MNRTTKKDRNGGANKSVEDKKRGNRRTYENRRERWRGHIRAELTRIRTRQLDCFVRPEWMAEVYGRPAEDVILDALCRHRGIGVESMTPEQSTDFDIDNRYESESARCRDSYEKRIVGSFFYHFMSFPIGYLQRLTREEQHQFFVKFYRKGDSGSTQMVIRAFANAMGKEVADV